MRTHIVAAFTGILFGLGLSISQMVNPGKVLGFLDVFGNWDPSLLLVITTATGFTMVSYRWVLKQSAPLFVDTFRLPTKTDIDSKLVVGSAIFGIGWGIAGYCPGPAIAASVLGDFDPAVFVLFLLIGTQIEKAWAWVGIWLSQNGEKI